MKSRVIVAAVCLLFASNSFALSPDLTNASPSQWKKYVGSTVFFEGLFTFKGEFAPFVSVKGGRVYIVGTMPTKPVPYFQQIDGHYIRVLGTLRFANSPPKGTKGGPARGYFYFDTEKLLTAVLR